MPVKGRQHFLSFSILPLSKWHFYSPKFRLRSTLSTSGTNLVFHQRGRAGVSMVTGSLLCREPCKKNRGCDVYDACYDVMVWAGIHSVKVISVHNRRFWMVSFVFMQCRHMTLILYIYNVQIYKQSASLQRQQISLTWLKQLISCFVFFNLVKLIVCFNFKIASTLEKTLGLLGKLSEYIELPSS